MNSVITRSLEKNKIKKRKSPKNLSLKNEYSEFLKKTKIKKSPRKKKIKTPSPKKKINIIENRKDPIFIKTNDVKKNVQRVRGRKKPEPKKPEPKKPEPKKPEPKKPEPKKPEPKKPEPKKSESKKPEPKKVKNVVSLKSKRRFSKKKRRKLDKKHTNTRKISFRCYPQKDKNIGDVMKKANKVSDDEMKKELLSNGIEIKGTKNKLLKDIYMFSLLGGIKIQKE
jgi:hypothetical protein